MDPFANKWQITETMMKLANEGKGWDIKKDRNKETKIGTMARRKNGNGILKLDSTAVSIEGTGRSRSQACACRIRAKKITAMEKPIICMNTVP